MATLAPSELANLFDNPSDATNGEEPFRTIVQVYGGHTFNEVQCIQIDLDPFDLAIFWMRDGPFRYYLASELLCAIELVLAQDDTKRLSSVVSLLSSEDWHDPRTTSFYAPAQLRAMRHFLNYVIQCDCAPGRDREIAAQGLRKWPAVQRQVATLASKLQEAIEPQNATVSKASGIKSSYRFLDDQRLEGEAFRFWIKDYQGETKSYLSSLTKDLLSSEASKRLNSAELLLLVEDSSTIRELEHFCVHEKDLQVKNAIFFRLLQEPDRERLEFVVHQSDVDERILYLALQMLGLRHLSLGREVLSKLLGHPSPSFDSVHSNMLARCLFRYTVFESYSSRFVKI